MAIIIQDMNMPAQCSQCPFHFRIDNAHTACSRNPLENPVEDGDERPKYCPLKEVEPKNNLSPRFPYRMERAKWYLMFLLLERIISFEEFDDLYGRLPEEYK